MDEANAVHPVAAAAAMQAAPKAAAAAAPLLPTACTSATVIQPEHLPKTSVGDSTWWMNTGLLGMYGVLATLLVKWIADIVQRRYELRQQLYLDLVDAVQISTNCVGKMCDTDIPLKTTAERYQGTAPAIAKVELIAPEKMSKALSEFKNKNGVAMMKLMEMRAEVERLNADSKGADEIIALHTTERRFLTEEMRRMSIDGVEDEARKTRVNGHYEYYSTEINKLNARKTANAVALQERVNEMATVAGQYLVELARLTVPVLRYARRELGFWRFDLRDYLRRTDDTTSMVQTALSDLQSTIKKTFNAGEDNGEKPDSDKKD
ncbi:MAG: hypothetical protein WA777_15675 [Rhodanobacter sp.]